MLPIKGFEAQISIESLEILRGTLPGERWRSSWSGPAFIAKRFG